VPSLIIGQVWRGGGGKQHQAPPGGGFLKTVHDSLNVSPDGNWLLYLGGGDLYVSQAGARPREITSGLAAAAWA
jgi:hypothetical protein